MKNDRYSIDIVIAVENLRPYPHYNIKSGHVLVFIR